MAKFANAKAVADIAREMSAAQLECREGHMWRPHTAEYDSDSQSYYRVRRCPRCKTLKAQVLDHTGSILSSSYIYDSKVGYLIHGLGRLAGDSRSAVRLESITREITHRATKKPRLRKVQ